MKVNEGVGVDEAEHLLGTKGNNDIADPRKEEVQQIITQLEHNKSLRTNTSNSVKKTFESTLARIPFLTTDQICIMKELWICTFNKFY